MISESGDYDPEIAELRSAIEEWLTGQGASGEALQSMVDEIMSDIWRGNGITLRALSDQNAET